MPDIELQDKSETESSTAISSFWVPGSLEMKLSEHIRSQTAWVEMVVGENEEESTVTTDANMGRESESLDWDTQLEGEGEVQQVRVSKHITPPGFQQIRISEHIIRI